MSNQTKQDFYIGWQEEMPSGYQTKVKSFLTLLLLVIPLAAAIFVLSQKGFKSSVFELGSLTTLEGVLVDAPVPMLKVPLGKSTQGQTVYQSVILVGFGKHGAEKDIENIQQASGEPWLGQWVKLRGTLIYYNGKVVMELSEGNAAFIEKGKQKSTYTLQTKDLGDVKLRGEIYDPKCALGVMKPGYGKPHRSCAVRCIAGGIPPLFRVANEAGRANYFLMLDPKGNKINEAVLDYVADQVQICGRLEQQDDWMILYVDPTKDMARLQHHFMEGPVVLCGEE